MMMAEGCPTWDLLNAPSHRMAAWKKPGPNWRISFANDFQGCCAHCHGIPSCKRVRGKSFLICNISIHHSTYQKHRRSKSRKYVIHPKVHRMGPDCRSTNCSPHVGRPGLSSPSVCGMHVTIVSSLASWACPVHTRSVYPKKSNPHAICSTRVACHGGMRPDYDQVGIRACAHVRSGAFAFADYIYTVFWWYVESIGPAACMTQVHIYDIIEMLQIETHVYN